MAPQRRAGGKILKLLREEEMATRRWQTAGAAMVIIAAVALLLVPMPTWAKATELVIASWESPEGTGMPPLRAWLQELTDKTGGKVTGKIAYGSVMGKPPEHYDLAATGVADVSYVGLPYTPGRFPMAEIIQLPVTGEASNETMAKAFWKLYEKGYFDKDFRDVKLLWVSTTSPYDYQMGKTTVRTFADMKGKKIRASGAVHTEIVKALGSTPVGMPAPEIYVSLEKGVIDGSFTPWSFIKAFRTEPVTKSVTEVGCAGLNFAIVMNKKVYDRLPADIKAIIDDISPKYTVITGKAHDVYAEEAKNLIKKAGGKIYQLSAADTDKVGKAVAPIWSKWIADGEAKGLPRKQLVADFYQILKGMGVAKPFHGYVP
jgi:TRAP-type C4-dicarboxylate transport system substrate-binding protein